MPAEKRCLILAAGFGTRMGPIGKKLPKVMWPVFEKSLLELQLLFARHLGYESIYINLHHQQQEILKRVEHHPSFAGVTWLVEQPHILDIGGGIHNLARRSEVSYQGELLVLNADQFLWFEASLLAELRAQKNWDAWLLGLQVNTDQGYNQLTLDQRGYLQNITPNSELARHQASLTYSGNSLICLDSLSPTDGASAFFVSVCPPVRQVRVKDFSSENYWDFGTAERYYRSVQRLMDKLVLGATDPFVDFLLRVGAIDLAKLRAELRSYGCSVPAVIHLGVGELPPGHPPGVVLEGGGQHLKETRLGLSFQGEFQPLSVL